MAYFRFKHEYKNSNNISLCNSGIICVPYMEFPDKSHQLCSKYKNICLEKARIQTTARMTRCSLPNGLMLLCFSWVLVIKKLCIVDTIKNWHTVSIDIFSFSTLSKFHQRNRRIIYITIIVALKNQKIHPNRKLECSHKLCNWEHFCESNLLLWQ